jgi:site-specific DNA recombinase
LIAERTVATMEDRVERGLWNGGHVYGYLSDPKSSGRLKPDPEWADKIRHNFFDAIERLGSAGAVQRELRALGILMPERTSRFGRKRGGRPFSKQQVIGILRNPIYIGRITWGELRKDDCHEAIIPNEQFCRVQRLLDETTKHRSNRRIARGHVYELRGLVRCSCGSAMTPKGAHGRRSKHFYYACTRQVHHGGRHACPSPNLPAEALEQAVLARIAEIGGQETAREKIIQAALKLIDVDAEAVERDMTTVRNRLGVIQAEIGNLSPSSKNSGSRAWQASGMS